MAEYVVGRRVTRYETAVVEAGSREEAVELARREGAFGGGFEEAGYDVFEATVAEVVHPAVHSVSPPLASDVRRAAPGSNAKSCAVG